MGEQPLEGFLGFDDADLAANRTGYLGPGQRPRLLWSGVWRLAVGPTILIVSVIVALLSRSALLSLGALLVAAFALYLAWHGFAFVVDVMDGTVAFVTGILGCTSVRGRNGTSYFAHIGPVTKRISARAYNSLPRATFHLYYAPGCRSLLSLEPATEDQPKPPHPFGPDSAHVWDRLRLSWIAMTIGVLGVVIGAHMIAVAHAAHPFAVDGTVTNYYEHHGKGGTTRSLSLSGDPNTYAPKSEDSYEPPLPSFYGLVGDEVTLYVNQGTSDVLAIRDNRETLHAGDWYLHPEHETVNEAANGAGTAAVSLLAIAIGVAVIAGWRRSPGAAEPSDESAPDPRYASAPMYSRSPLFAPPSVRPWQRSWMAALALLLVFIAAGAGLGLLAGALTR